MLGELGFWLTEYEKQHPGTAKKLGIMFLIIALACALKLAGLF